MDRNSFIKSKIFCFSLVLIIGIMINFSNASGETPLEIPSWLKNTAKYWAEDSISNEEFVQAIQWLINEDFITIPQQGGSTQEIQMNSYQQYQFGFWQDNGSTDPIREFTMNGDSLNNIAIYNIIS